jgi:hypothetical protein
MSSRFRALLSGFLLLSVYLGGFSAEAPFKFESTPGRSAEAIWLVPWVAHDGEQPELAWKFAREHISQLLARTEEFMRNIYVPAIMSAFNDAAHADELEQCVRENAPKGMTKAKESAESMRLASAIRQRELPGIDSWVAAKTQSVQ